MHHLCSPSQEWDYHRVTKRSRAKKLRVRTAVPDQNDLTSKRLLHQLPATTRMEYRIVAAWTGWFCSPGDSYSTATGAALYPTKKGSSLRTSLTSFSTSLYIIERAMGLAVFVCVCVRVLIAVVPVIDVVMLRLVDTVRKR
jgi:hypothetical protein